MREWCALGMVVVSDGHIHIICICARRGETYARPIAGVCIMTTVAANIINAVSPALRSQVGVSSSDMVGSIDQFATTQRDA